MREDTQTFLFKFLHGHGAREFLESFRAWAHAFSWLKAAPDHFCYRCRDGGEYEAIRARFEERSRFIYQSIISGRRIAVIGLADPVSTPLGDLRVLELSDRKPSGEDRSGYDHVEIYPTEGDLDALAGLLNGVRLRAFDVGTMSAFERKGRPHHATWDAKLAFDPLRIDRKDLILRLTAEPLVAKIAQEMR